MTESIVSKLRRDDRLPEALALILGRAVRPDRTFAIRCPDAAAHAHGDRSASAVVKPRAGRVDCAACGATFGLLALGVALGVASTPAGAARWLEDRFGRPSARGRAPAPSPAASAPVVDWFGRMRAARSAWERGRTARPDAARRAAGSVSLDVDGFHLAGGGVEGSKDGPVFVLPVWERPWRLCGLKLRRDPPFHVGERTTRTMLARGSSPGLLNLPALLAVRDLPGASVVFCEGESDLGALVGELDRARVANVVALSPSHGVRQSLAPWGALLRGLPVAIAYDVDDAGREGAAQAMRDLARYVPSPRVVRLPLTAAEAADTATNDLRHYLATRGDVRAFLRLVEGRQPSEAGLFAEGAIR